MRNKTFSEILEDLEPKIKDKFTDRSSIVMALNGSRAGLIVSSEKNDIEGVQILTDLVELYKKSHPGRQYHEKRKRLS